MEKSYWVNTAMMGLLAQSDDLSLTELRVLIGIMALHEDGPVTMSQQAIADWIGIQRQKVSKALLHLIEMGYIRRDGMTHTVDESLLFCGKRNQKAKRFRMYINETIRERRKRFREKIDTEGPDNRPGWTGYAQKADGTWTCSAGADVRWEGEPYTGPCPLENFNG